MPNSCHIFDSSFVTFSLCWWAGDVSQDCVLRCHSDALPPLLEVFVRTRPVRSASVLGVAIGFAATALFGAPAAQAAPTAKPDPATQASTLAKQLGTRTAGSYLDQQTGKLVV